MLNQSTHTSVANSTASKAAPWPPPMDHLGLVEAVDGFGESVVIGISDTTNGRLDASFSQALGVLDRDVLGGFKRSSQQRFCSLMIANRQAPPPAFSIPASFSVGR